MKVATWNVNSLRVRIDQVCDWLQKNPIDLLCLQELKMPDEDFPIDKFQALGYHCNFTGQKTYNGVATISKEPISEAIINLPNFEDPQRRYIQVEYQGVTVVNVYVPNGQSLDSEKFGYKREWFSKLQQTMRSLLDKNSQVILVGDFNITPSDLDVYDPVKWRNKIHCSDIERLMLQNLMSEGLYDTFRHQCADADKYSWWDYRTDGYSRNEGLRIDLILASSKMLDRLSKCIIDEEPRKLERPSDHTPVVATF